MGVYRSGGLRSLVWLRPMPDGGEGLEVAISLRKQFVLSPKGLAFETFGELVDSLRPIGSEPPQRTN